MTRRDNIGYWLVLGTLADHQAQRTRRGEQVSGFQREFPTGIDPHAPEFRGGGVCGRTPTDNANNIFKQKVKA